MSERWRPVVGYEGLYEVSDQGSVRSLERTVASSDGRRCTFRGVDLKPALRADGHLQVTLSRDGRRRTRKVHQLVIEAFVGVRPDGLEVCHNDGDSVNNHLTNLRYGTRSENVRDAVRHGSHGRAARTQCPRGHPYSESNTYVWNRGRHCRTCVAHATKRYRARKASA